MKTSGPTLRMSSLKQALRDPMHFKNQLFDPSYLIRSSCVIYYERAESREALLRSFLPAPTTCTPPSFLLLLLHPFLQGDLIERDEERRGRSVAAGCSLDAPAGCVMAPI